MCLILFSWNNHPKYKLIVAANRDEFYARPSSQAQFWEENSSILAGRDLEAGGTWLGIEKSGLFAAVTNYRDLSSIKETAISRGNLTKDFLESKFDPEDYLKKIATKKDQYNGFNLIVSDLKKFYYYSNKEDRIKNLESGIYGLSNHLLDSPWPKVENGKILFENIIKREEFTNEELFKLLQNVDQAQEELLPSTGISKDWEKALSSIFIKTPDYGTYCSTVLLVDYDDNCQFTERTYAEGTAQLDKNFDFRAG